MIRASTITRRSLRWLKHSFLFFICLFLITSHLSPVWAQNGDDTTGILAPSSDSDWAIGFINILLGSSDAKDIPLIGNLAPIADAFHRALGVYSYAMLILAGFLLFYHIASMVTETAHQGVIMGRRANQVWAPIRLVVAILLLIPIGGGLSIGQHIVIKIASSGSNLASHAWESLAGSLSGTFFRLVTPSQPDLSRFVMTSVEMELCRDIYEQTRLAQSTDPTIRYAGTMGELEKLPAVSFMPETWRYTNSLDNAEPMCGEYRFSGYRSHLRVNPLYADGIAHIADDVATFSHAEADATLTRARLIAGYMAPSFGATDIASPPDVQTDLSAMRQALQQNITLHLQSMTAAQNALAQKYLSQSNSAGWISAAFFIPDLVRLQESYGELVDHILPDVQEPVFIHPLITQKVLSDTMANEPALFGTNHDISDGMARFYTHLSNSNARAHALLSSNRDENSGFVTSNGFDLRDHVNASTDASALFTYFANALDTAALNHGVWGGGLGTQDQGNPFTSSDYIQNDNLLTALIEFGRRQFALGTYLLGLASSVITMPQIVAPSLIIALTGLFFIVGGLGLVFLIPLLPFVRFLLAILVWLMELLEAIIAMPLVALAHLTPSGEGLSGSAARQAYMLWVALAIRPLLSIFGLVVGVMIFALGTSILVIAFSPLSQLAALTNSGLLIVANISLVLIYDLLIYAIANIAFQGINRFPDQALRWISPFIMSDHSHNQTPTSSNTPATSTSTPLTALMHKVTGETYGARDPRNTTASSNATAQAPLLPAYHQKASGSEIKQGDLKRKSSGVSSPSSTATALASSASGVTGVGLKKDPKTKKKDDKDMLFTQDPFMPDTNKKEK